MHAVGGPMLWWRILNGLIEHRLEGNEYRMISLSHPTSSSAIRIKFWKPSIVYCAAAQHERFTNNQFHLGQGLLSAVHERAVIMLVNLDGAL